jgi:undecaprenyl-diphosphatase
MPLLKVIILAIIQGLAELLPVSSSAHVVVAEKLLGLDPSSPPMTLLLVMLHTGTMFAVIVYFWPQWREIYFKSAQTFQSTALLVVLATAATAVVGESLIKFIEGTVFHRIPGAQVENLFGRLDWVAPALAIAGLLILGAGLYERRCARIGRPSPADITMTQAGIIGTVQGFCLPFRGFSRSGATISTAMLLGISKTQAEAFSFALAVVLTPPVVVREVLRLVHSPATQDQLTTVVVPSLLGSIVAFVAGLLALKWLSKWLEGGRWYLFGIYCLAAAAIVYALHIAGY